MRLFRDYVRDCIKQDYGIVKVYDGDEFITELRIEDFPSIGDFIKTLSWYIRQGLEIEFVD